MKRLKHKSLHNYQKEVEVKPKYDKSVPCFVIAIVLLRK